MKFFFYIIFIAFIVGCDNKYYHDTGLAYGKHDCTIWEYLHKDSENWDSTIILIKHAGLVDLFDGKESQYSEITFFGPTNFSIMQFLYKTVDANGDMIYDKITDIPEDVCKRIVLSHVIEGKFEKEDFDYEIKGTLTGGTVFKTLNENELRIYRTQSTYYGIPDLGPESLAIHSLEKGHIAPIASADIEMNNGYVHSLSYTYQLTEL